MKSAQCGSWSTAKIVQYQSTTVAIAWWTMVVCSLSSVLELGER